MTVLEAIRLRRSVREYSPRPIPLEVLQKMKDAMRLAPSACNHQPWRFILVGDAKLREGVARAAREQMWMAPAPVTVVACGFPDRAYPRMAGRYNSAEIDVAIALDHLTLAAVAEGLGTCWIGAFNEEQVRAILGIPREVRVVAMTPLGYPARPELIRPAAPDYRKPEAEVIAVDRF